MRAGFRYRQVDFVHATIIAALLLLVLTHLPAAYDSYRIRHRVLAGLEQAKRAQELVVANALAGRSLAQAWTDSIAGEAAGISIAPESGIVTITYPADIDGGGKTLVLIPAYRRQDQDYPLAAKADSRAKLVTENIIWTCTSSLTVSRKTFIKQHIGTLQSKYAPAACRFVNRIR